MSKEEFLKIQTCVLKVNIHCDGCKQKVKKILQKIDGVYTTKIDSEQGKVTVSGNVDPSTLIKKLVKAGKYAELWGPPKPSSNNQNQLNNQMKNLQLGNGKGGGGAGGGGQANNNNKNNQQKGGNGNNQSNKGGGGGVQLTPQQLQQLQQQMKGFPNPKMPPQLKDMKFPPDQNPNPNSKSVKFDIPGEGDYEDDSEDLDDDDFDDDEYDDEFDDDPMPVNKMKMPPSAMGNPPNMMMTHQNPHMANVLNSMKAGNPAGGNGKKPPGGCDQLPAGGKKSGAGGGGNQKNGKNGNPGGKPAGGGGVNGKKPAGVPNLPMNAGFPNGNGPQMGQMGQMGPMGPAQMSNGPPVSGLPVGTGGGHYQGSDVMHGNPYQQQQMMAAMMMNQQRANGNERFQPMMYARPPPATNYMPPPYPYPYPYPYPPPPSDYYSNYFSDENTSSCSIM